MDNDKEMPVALLELIGRTYATLEPAEQEMVRGWFTEEEFDSLSLAALSVQEERAATIPPVRSAAVFEEALARNRSRRRRLPVSRKIPVWQAAALILVFVAVAVGVTRQLTGTHAVVHTDTVYIVRDMPSVREGDAAPAVITARDAGGGPPVAAVTGASAAERGVNAVTGEPDQVQADGPPRTVPEQIYAIGAGVYVIDPESKEAAENTPSAFTLRDDTLQEIFGFVHF